MKLRSICPIALSAALIALPGAAHSQDDKPPAPEDLALAAPGAYDVGLDLAAGNDEGALLRQLEELDAATARKRAELRARLSQLKQQQKRAELLGRQSSEDPDGGPGKLANPFGPAPTQKRWMIGVQVSPRNPDSGVRVEFAMEKMPAAKAGMRTGDVIKSVNAIRVRDVGALNAIINAAGDQELALGIRREDEEIEIKLTPEQVPGSDRPNPPRPREADPFGDGGVDRLRGFRLRPGQEGLIPQLLPFGDNDPQRARVPPNPPRSAEIESLKQDIEQLRKLVEELVGKGKRAADESGSEAAADSGEN